MTGTAWIIFSLRAVFFVSIILQVTDVASSKQRDTELAHNQHSKLSKKYDPPDHTQRLSLGFWGQWSNWSPCSRTSGRGVSTQVRQCLNNPRRFRRTRRKPHLNNNKQRPGNQQHSISRCVGVYKRFQVCNVNSASVDIRREQCSAFNLRPFNGRYYIWEPYFKDVEDCELNCRPVGHKFYATFNKAVEDGTSCTIFANSDRVCIAGKCKSVGCDGLIGSDKNGDQCSSGCECSNNTCRIVSGLFTRPTLSAGYNLIAQLPKGACNINITELKQSRNYLALRTEDGKYFLNGDWAINWSGDHKAAGTTFHYIRHETNSLLGESITAKGPLTEPVELFVIYQQPNPGIKYEYMLSTRHGIGRSGPQVKPPVGFQPQSDSQILSRRTSAGVPPHTASSPDLNHLPNNWRRPVLSGHDPRLVPPGKHPYPNRGSPPSIINGHHGGILLPDKNQQSYPWRKRPPKPEPRSRIGDVNTFGYQRSATGIESSAAHLNVINNAGYNLHHDKTFRYYKWKVSGFSECSQSCAGGTQTMVVSCVKESTLVVVPDIHCDASTKPEAQKVKCNTHPCPASWVAEEWSACTATCGEGTQTREVACYQQISPTLRMHVTEAACFDNARPPTVQQCKQKPCSKWRVGDWEKCSAECGKGMRRREVRCIQGNNQHIVSDEDCKGQEKPLIEEMCDMGPCTNTWFFSEWSQTCSEECGGGVNTRHVLCLRGNGGPSENTGEGACDASTKPSSERPCANSKPCGGKWFAGPWEQCSAACGNGTQVRDVVCMTSARGQWHAALDVHCVESEKPPIEQPCESQKPCQPEWFVSDWTECSKSCNTGVQSREVTCLDEKQHLSQDCLESSKPVLRQACNTNDCPEVSQDSGCVDTFRSCPLVVQARLCGYQYYRNICCDSCYKM